MRLSLLATAFVVSLSGSVFAQEWSLYVNAQDGFKINFPGEPKVTSTTWVSEQGYILPARVYTAEITTCAEVVFRRVSRILHMTS